MNTKQARQEAIARIIRTEKIPTQEELQKWLHANGFSVTQATLSRDIKHLKIARAHDENGAYAYQPTDMTPTLPDIRPVDVPSSLEFSGNLAVVKTRPGYAMGVASDIDASAPQEILATVAGDDTILIIPREGYSRQDIAGAVAPFICHYD
jgi:transcriptional regulator of arginine metabolism